MPGRTPEQATHRLAPAHVGDGKPRVGALTRRQAQDALADVLAVERRKVGERAYDHQPDAATFADAAAGFLRHVEHVRGREFATVKDYRLSIRRYLDPRWAARPVVSIAPAEVARLRDDLLAAGLSPRTVVRHLTVAHGVFKHAVREHGLARNPASAELVDRPTVSYSGEFDTLDAEELAALARAAGDEQDAALYLTAAKTGLRQGELMALRWRDLDFARQRPCQALVVAGRPNREGSEVGQGSLRPVRRRPRRPARRAEPPRTVHRRGRPRVLFGAGRPPGRVGVAPPLRNGADQGRAVARALPLATPLLRSMAVQTFAISDVQAMLGHAHVTTTQRYVHHRPGADDAARLSRAFRGETVSPPVSRNGPIGSNSAQLSDTETPANG